MFMINKVKLKTIKTFSIWCFSNKFFRRLKDE